MVEHRCEIVEGTFGTEEGCERCRGLGIIDQIPGHDAAQVGDDPSLVLGTNRLRHRVGEVAAIASRSTAASGRSSALDPVEVRFALLGEGGHRLDAGAHQLGGVLAVGCQQASRIGSTMVAVSIRELIGLWQGRAAMA